MYQFPRIFLSAALSLLLLLPPNHFASAAPNRAIQPVQVQARTQNNEEVSFFYEESHALVIGVSEYTHGWSGLKGVQHDLQEVSAALERNGFQVHRLPNPDLLQLRMAIEDFIYQYGAKENNRVLIYYAGHGHTMELAGGRSMGYLVPVDAPNPHKDPLGFRRKSMSMQEIEVFAKETVAKHALFMFDACFAGSVFRATRAAPAYIQRHTQEPVRQFITSGSEAQEVPDDSIFRQAFLEALEGSVDSDGDGYFTGSDLGAYIFKRTVESVKGLDPQYGKLRDSELNRGDFVFAVSRQPLAPTVANNLPSSPSSSSFSLEDLEEVADQREALRNAWRSKQDEMDSAFAQVEAYQQRNVAAALKIEAWQRFADAFREDNPYSSADDTQRSQAQSSIAYWQNEEARFADQEREAEQQRQEELARKQREAEAEQQRQEKAAIRPTPNDTYTEPTTGMKFIRVSGGNFQMGDLFGDGRDNEKAIRTVRLNDFWMGQTEVTQGQWKAIMGNNPSKFDSFFSNDNNRPVEGVSWNDAQEFIRKLNAKHNGNPFRLPSEAEWEYACREGGKKVKYGTGKNTVDFNSANIDNNIGETTEVGKYEANALNLYDMSGNVWEWTQDKYTSDYSDVGTDNPIYERSGSYRVVRGGGWKVRPQGVRCTLRFLLSPSDASDDLGFRLVRQEQ